jgi:hypothetical protein
VDKLVGDLTKPMRIVDSNGQLHGMFRWPHPAENWRLEPVWFDPLAGPAVLAVPAGGIPLLCRIRKYQVTPSGDEETVIDAINTPSLGPTYLFDPTYSSTKQLAFVNVSGHFETSLIIAFKFLLHRARMIRFSSDYNTTIIIDRQDTSSHVLFRNFSRFS